MSKSKYMGKKFGTYKVVRAKAAPGGHTIFSLTSAAGKHITLRDNALTAISRGEKKVCDYIR